MSTLSVTTINTANGTTDLTVASGNTSAGRIIVQSGGGAYIQSNSTTNAFFVAANGNVGIRTSSPPTRFTSNGVIRVQSITGTGFIDMNHDGTNGSLVSNTGSFLFYAEGTNSIVFHTNAAQRGVFDGSGNFQFNSGYGSVATAYGCRAWVNFNGTGTVAIRSSGNITSITDNGVGDYTVNFTNAMPDANYCTTAITDATTTRPVPTVTRSVTLSTTGYRVVCEDPYTNGLQKVDAATFCVSIVR